MQSHRLRAATLALSLPLCGCNIALLPDDYMNALGVQTYAEETAKYPVVTGTANAAMVQRAGQKIAAASGKSYEWEFKLLQAPDVVNAFCLPGGKIAVYSGLIEVTENEDALAAVMGHEVAHATQQHGNKRMTQGIGLSIGMAALQGVLANWEDADEGTKDQIMMALGVGAQYGLVLPYSREHESEADEVGLRYLVRAGYDPNEAPKLWDRMAQAFPDRPPEFMSTHPDPARRAQRLREIIPRIVAEETVSQ